MAYTILYSITDEKNLTSTTEVNVPEGTDYADVAIMAGEVAKLIDPLITGQITRIGIVNNVALPGGLTASPAANSDVEEGARWQFNTAGGFYTGLRLATFDEDRLLAGTRDVDPADTDVAAFQTAMVDGIDLTAAGGSATVQPCDKRGDDITALEFAREQFLASRRRG